MTQIHKVYLIWPHSGTSGTTTFRSSEAFCVPYELYCPMSAPPKLNSRSPATMLNLRQQHKRAIIIHIVDTGYVQSPFCLLETWPVACVKNIKRESYKNKMCAV